MKGLHPDFKMASAQAHGCEACTQLIAYTDGASVLRMLRAARVSVPLTTLLDLKYAPGVVLGKDRALSEIPLTERGATLQATCWY